MADTRLEIDISYEVDHVDGDVGVETAVATIVNEEFCKFGAAVADRLDRAGITVDGFEYEESDED